MQERMRKTRTPESHTVIFNYLIVSESEHVNNFIKKS